MQTNVIHRRQHRSFFAAIIPRRHSSMSRVIPHEIWLHIAQFIPETSLQNLYTINRSFFEIAMNARYREVHFSNFDSAMFWKFHRLKYTIYFHSRRYSDKHFFLMNKEILPSQDVFATFISLWIRGSHRTMKSVTTEEKLSFRGRHGK